jgi:hypothetical protein
VAHVQPFVLALVVPGFGWAAAIYGLVVAGALVVLAAPPRLRHPVAFATTTLALTTALTGITVPAALIWFAPVLLIKPLLGHLLPGEAGPCSNEPANRSSAPVRKARWETSPPGSSCRSVIGGPELPRVLAQGRDQLVLAHRRAAFDLQLPSPLAKVLDAALLVGPPIRGAVLLGLLALGRLGPGRP